jgi:hypothetical protein
MKAFRFPHLLLLVFTHLFFPALTTQAQQAQKQVCDEERAVLLAEKQIEEVSMLDQPQRQIAVMVRAADVLWNARPSAARKIFKDAFDLAEKVFKEKRNEIQLEGGLLIIPDQRFVVMQAIAKYDPAWVKRLADRIVEETKKQAELKTGETKRHPSDVTLSQVHNRILDFAISATIVDPTTAASLIRSTFSNRLSTTLPQALYALAEVNQAMADQLYLEALTVYANAPIDEFLYLSAFPFVKNHSLGLYKEVITHTVPSNISPTPMLQRLFIETIVRRAETNLRMPEQPTNPFMKMPESAHLFAAFRHLEILALQYQPSYVNRIVEMKNYLNASLDEDRREQIEILSSAYAETGLEARLKEGMFGKALFTEYSEEAERETDPAKREWAMMTAILYALNEVSVEDLIGLARKIDDEKLRNQLLNVIYFKRTQKAIKDGQFFEASQLAKNIEQLDFRAYLAYEIAAASLKKDEERFRARGILEEVLELAYKAPNTSEKVRTLLGVVYLYAKIDKTRAFEVMAEAVNTINKIDNSDFSTTHIRQMILGKRTASSSDYHVEAFNLETVFSLLAPIDFDGALWRARSLDDKSQRALAVLALAASCLEELERVKKQDAQKKKKDRPRAANPEEAESKKPPAKLPVKP